MFLFALFFSFWKMLNAESKILAKVLTNWLQTVLDCLITPKKILVMWRVRLFEDDLNLLHIIIEKVDGEAALISPKCLKGLIIDFILFFFAILCADDVKPHFRHGYACCNRSIMSKPFMFSQSIQDCSLSPMLYDPFVGAFTAKTKVKYVRGRNYATPSASTVLRQCRD